LTNDDDAARKKRAAELRKKIAELTSESDRTVPDRPEQQPGESDAEYVQRRMREVEKKQ